MNLSLFLSGRGWLLVALLGPGLPCAAAGAAPAEIRWNELAALVAGHDVWIPLAGGQLVAGQALAVRDQSLLLDIRKSSDTSRYPRGQASLPRASITEVRVLEHRGVGGRVLGSIVGALAGMVAGAEIAIHGTHSEAAGASTFTATAVACTVGGYYAGRSADRRKRLLRIAPPASALGPPAVEGRRLVPAGDGADARQVQNLRNTGLQR